MKNTGDKIFINGKEYILGNKLGGGLEGNVFDVEGLPDYVIKLINDRNMSELEYKDTYNHLKWLKDIVGHNSTIKQKLAVPKGLLDEDLGYIMRKADAHQSVIKFLNPPQENFNDWYKNDYTLKKRYQIINYMFNGLRDIHIEGLIFTDLSPNNIMVHNTQNQIVFIDTDNMRRRTDAYLGVLGTPGYMAPEIYRMTDKAITEKYGIDQNIFSKAGKITVDSDIFSAAIIAFMLLTMQHPFIGDEVEEGTAEDEEKAQRCETDYILKKGTTNTSSNPFVNIFNKISTPEIRELFKRTFVDGKNRPQLRPTDSEFQEAFSNALDLIVKCQKCGFEHLYSLCEENICGDCNEKLPKKTTLEIYNVYQEKGRINLVNSITDSVDDKNVANNHENQIVVSQIVLEAGEKKFLYLRHFEETTKRSQIFAVVTLIDVISKIVEVQILNDSFKNPMLMEKKTRKLKPINDINKSFQFRLDDYAIIFEIKESRVGTIKILGIFSPGEDLIE